MIINQSFKERIKISGFICCGLTTFLTGNSATVKKQDSARPNILVVLADQWRADAFKYRGNPDVLTPNIDKLASEGVEFINAISGIPVCTPARGSIMTGQRPLTNGVFMNDVQLNPNAVSLAKVMAQADYQTACIGKWHLDGNGRNSFIPQGARRQGFQYWKVLECTHNYNHSIYYADTPDTLLWKGYDVFAQTEDARNYIRIHSGDEKPFLLFLAWGPPHEPYQTAPEKYKQMYSPENIHLRPNVPDEQKKKAQKDIAGYYAHCTALDDKFGELRKVLNETGIADNTIILFMSDHGDLLGSHGFYNKQQPYDESIRIPMIFYVPGNLGGKSGKLDAMINVEDVMPTILGLCAVNIPKTVEGVDYSKYIKGGKNQADTITGISCVQPFGQWNRLHGGKEYRGIRSPRYTYVKDLNGPWLFFDNKKDPYQMNNLVDKKEYLSLINSFDLLLMNRLKANSDQFLTGLEYVKKYNYPLLDKTETVPYH